MFWHAWFPGEISAYNCCFVLHGFYATINQRNTQQCSHNRYSLGSAALPVSVIKGCSSGLFICWKMHHAALINKSGRYPWSLYLVSGIRHSNFWDLSSMFVWAPVRNTFLLAITLVNIAKFVPIMNSTAVCEAILWLCTAGDLKPHQWANHYSLGHLKCGLY